MDSKKIAIFVLFTVLSSFLYIVVNAELTGQATREKPKINVEGASCAWKEDHFEICETISWQADVTHYAKGYIAGGEVLTKSPKLTLSPTIYCQNVGPTEAKRAVHAYLYNTQGTIKALNIDNVVTCSRKPQEFDSKTQSFSTQAKKLIKARAKSSDTFHIQGFGGTPTTCTFSGHWITNGRVIENIDVCHQATGEFTGTFSSGVQRTTVDAHPFAWSNIVGLYRDPDSEEFPGYVAYAKLCDRTDYDAGRYYARLRVIEADNAGLTLEWEYANVADLRVDFIGEVTCEIIKEEAEWSPAADKAESEIIEEQIIEEPEPALEEETGEAIVTQEPWSFWKSVGAFFRRIFS